MIKRISALVIAAFLYTGSALAQDAEKVPKNWHLLDPGSGYEGISLDKAYAFIKLKNLKSKQLTVAVIDTGIDTLHEELKPVLWNNPKEIAGNGKDDDGNGYIDDIHGWNFLGGKDGRVVVQDSDEGSRVYYSLKPKWENREVVESSLTPAEMNEYKLYIKAKNKTLGGIDPAETEYLKQLQPKLIAGDSIIRKELGKVEYNGDDLKKYTTQNIDAKMVRNFILNVSKANNSYDITNTQLLEEFNGDLRKADAAKNPPPSYRKDIVQDDENNFNDNHYGNNNIMAGQPMHGTFCSGIIAAVRNNNKGIDGIADNVRIMMLRVVPDGDEHDKDIANAIRYAVNQGAKIINMSFGKDFSPQKQWVDEAIRYAESKGVLLVHAAGNDAKNIDTADNFPNPVFQDGNGRASNVITVGASGNLKNGGITASFSNYGKSEVDVFAPGVNIYSTLPGENMYGVLSGTSFSGPVVAGIAALIMEYYPALSPQQVIMAIEKTAVFPNEKVLIPGTDEKVDMRQLSKTGIVNAFEAIKYASTIKPAIQKEVLPKSKIKKEKLG